MGYWLVVDLPQKTMVNINGYYMVNGGYIIIIWLVVWTPLKNMKVNGKDYPISDGEWKMFETTNQMFLFVGAMVIYIGTVYWMFGNQLGTLVGIYWNKNTSGWRTCDLEIPHLINQMLENILILKPTRHLFFISNVSPPMFSRRSIPKNSSKSVLVGYISSLSF